MSNELLLRAFKRPNHRRHCARSAAIHSAATHPLRAVIRDPHRCATSSVHRLARVAVPSSHGAAAGGALFSGFTYGGTGFAIPRAGADV